MKLVKFQCTVRQTRAKEQGEDIPEAHTIWINPDDVQMVTPENEAGDTRIAFKGQGGSTSVEGTQEEVVAALTSA